MTEVEDIRKDQLKRLFIKFRHQLTIPNEHHSDFDQFGKLLELNQSLAVPRNINITTWSLVNEKQTQQCRDEHGHIIVMADRLVSKRSFLELCKENNKCQTNESSECINIVTPSTQPPSLTSGGLAASDAPSSILNFGPGAEMSNMSIMSAKSNKSNGPKIADMRSQMNNMGGSFSQLSNNNQLNNNDFGDDISVMNSFADNMNYVEQMNNEHKRNGNQFEDDGSGNVGIEVIRMNKKFDIFMKRFMRAEEDIKEIKQNFYRVMHCAFAKYEQGFKRKNEYLERRRVKKNEEVSKGVQQELKKRQANGEIDSKVLTSLGNRPAALEDDDDEDIDCRPNKNGKNFSHEESSLNLNNLGADDSSLSLGKLGGGLGLDDSDLGISKDAADYDSLASLGTKSLTKVDSLQNKADKKKDKKKKDKKMKKDKKEKEAAKITEVDKSGVAGNTRRSKETVEVIE